MSYELLRIVRYNGYAVSEILAYCIEYNEYRLSLKNVINNSVIFNLFLWEVKLLEWFTQNKIYIFMHTMKENSFGHSLYAQKHLNIL